MKRVVWIIHCCFAPLTAGYFLLAEARFGCIGFIRFGESCPCGFGVFLDFVGIGRENGEIAAASILAFALAICLARRLTVKRREV